MLCLGAVGSILCVLLADIRRRHSRTSLMTVQIYTNVLRAFLGAAAFGLHSLQGIKALITVCRLSVGQHTCGQDIHPSSWPWATAKVPRARRLSFSRYEPAACVQIWQWCRFMVTMQVDNLFISRY